MGNFSAQGLWCLTAGAGRCSAAERAALAASAAAIPGPVLLATCERVELYGTGQPPAAGGFELLTGMDAAEHLLRVAAGLESAVVGEAEVLTQVRSALRERLATGPIDPSLRRAFDAAIAAGRRARRRRPPTAPGLAAIAAGWVAEHAASKRAVVAGAGMMGTALASALGRSGFDVVVASRDRGRAAAAAARARATAATLDEARETARAAGAIAVALGGPWQVDGRLPATVDVSVPAAVPAHLCAAYVGIDELLALPRPDDPEYRPIAEAVVESELRQLGVALAGRGAA